MRPLKAKELIAATALELNLPVDIVTIIVKAYYEDVREALTEMKDPRVHLTNLGDFTVKFWLLDKYINRYKGFIENSIPHGIKGGILLKDAQYKLEVLQNVKKIISDEQQRKEFIKHHKITLNDKRKSNKNMEKQEPDSGGDKE